MPRHPNKQALTVNSQRVDAKPKRRSFTPGRYGAWYEEMLREREEQMNRAPEDRPGAFRTVKNGDFSEEEIRKMERLYGAKIRRP
jgi:hypothetical protein